MLIPGTQLSFVVFWFIVLEFCMFIWQSARYFYRINDRHRGRYLLLLLLLMLCNATGGLFPDPKMPFSIAGQHMIAYGAAFFTASYFPFYFYKEFDLKILRRHALFGAPVFLLLPYLIFFVILYAINDDLKKDMRYGVIVPFIYAVVLLWVILSAIRTRYQHSRDGHKYIEELAVYCAVFPWMVITLFAWFPVSQLTEALCANTGFLVITVIFFVKSAKRATVEYLRQNQVTIGTTSPELFQANCLHFGLTRMEIRIIQQLYKGLSNKEIAEIMSVSEDTIKKHIQNIFRKVNVNNRARLIHKLQNHPY